MATVADILKTARLPEKKVPVCLRGDLAVEADRLIGELQQAQKTPVTDDRLGAPDATADLRNALDNVRAEMEADTTDWRIRALSKDEWDALVLAHPAEAGSSDASDFGYDFMAVRAATLRVALVDPHVDSDEEWDQLRGAVPAGQWDELVGAAHTLAQSKVSVPSPFWRVPSPASPASSEASA